MLNIFTARENIDTKKFMYERIADAMKERRVFLVVPEQSTLRAEADAFDYMGVPGFIDFDVLSMTSLGRRIIDEVGYGALGASGDGNGGAANGGVASGDDGDGVADGGDSGGGVAEPPGFISKYGKYMLLSRLLYRHKNEMLTFKHLEASPDFVEQLNDMIAEMKNHNVTPDGLKDIVGDLKSESILKRKLEDAALIYDGYETAIAGKYIDTTDHLKLYTSKMGKAGFIPGAEFWLHGFDYLSPAVMDAVIELAHYAYDVNIVLTSDDDPLFILTNDVATELTRRALDTGVRASTHHVPLGEASCYVQKMPPEIAHIEKALFTRPYTPYEGDTTGSLKLIAAANYYVEAETAAAEICSLVRDGMDSADGEHIEIRYRDVLVLCNDMAERGPIIRRVFQRYGLPVFMDKRRSVEHNPVVEFILALPRIAASGRTYEDVFTLLKTGLADIGSDEVCELENYVLRYNIRGKRWDRDFTLGLKHENDDGRISGEYGQDEMDALNESRDKVQTLIAAFEKDFKSGRTAKERTDALLVFVIGQAKLPEMIERLGAELDGNGMLEYAAEMAGVWDMAVEILGQMGTVLGDLVMSMDEYATVLRTGLDSVHVGVLPTVMDQIVLGTMQRTRSGGAKAVFVIGANDGVLPAPGRSGAILSEDEIYRLADSGHYVARTEDTTHMEEELAIYRNLAKPQFLLRVSYAASDSSGKTISQSPVFERLRRLFPNVPVARDIHNSGATLIDATTNAAEEHTAIPLIIQHPDQTLDYLSEQLRVHIRGDVIPEVWKDVFAWYRDNRARELARVKAGLTFRGRRERIDTKFVEGLYRKTTSPSALEKYSRCPFSWFMAYGIGLKERRVYGVDSRSLGDIYHNVLMRFGRELSSDGLSARDGESAWQKITDGEIDDMVVRLTAEEYTRFEAGYVGGADEAPGDAAEIALDNYRRDRVARTATAAARTLTQQIRDGEVDDIYFESAFGKHGDFPAITTPMVNAPAVTTIETVGSGTGEGIRIEGRIDRVDILEGGFARIIDYKSGAQEFSAPDAETGYQLQLIIYLQAVSERYKPAGVFYFRIKEPRIEDDGSTDVAAEIQKNMKLDGVAVNDSRVLTAMGIDSDGRARKGRMDPDEWEALRESVSGLLKDLVGDLSSGRIDAAPKTAIKLKTSASRNQNACDYCPYKGICNYDPAF